LFALVVSMRVRPERRDGFIDAMTENAVAALRDEPGCRVFDVLEDDDDPGHFVLYENYDDRAAFEHHRTTPHFARWRSVADEYLQPEGGQHNTYLTKRFPS